MAKLTARFDMQDKMTKKLKNMHGDLENLQKTRDKINKPIVMEAKDKASKQINKINDTVEKVVGSKEIVFSAVDKASKQMNKINKTAEKVIEPKSITMNVVDKVTKPVESISRLMEKRLPKTHSLLVYVNDKASVQLESINNYIKRRMPRAHEMIVRVRNRSTSVLEGINRYLGRNILGMHVFEIMARDRAMPTMHKIANYGRRMLSKGYNFSVRAIDIATKTVGRIASYARTALPAYRDFTIRAIDKATMMIGTIKNALFSLPTMITVGLAVIGVGGLGKATIGSAMNFEGYETAMTHWLDGNQKKADKLIGWMGQFADTTPFSSAELFPALSRGIGVSGGDIKQAKQLLEISSNMAALTPGKTVQEAMEALADASMGEFERMKEFNMKITQDDFDSAGWVGIVNEIDSTFEDGAKKFSQTASGQIPTIKGYASTIFREAGTGILTSMKPRLDEITSWLNNNQDTWGEWKDTVQSAGEDAANWVFTKLEGAFSYLRDNYLENDEFKNLDFEGKVNFIMEDIGDWWDKTGAPLLAEIGKDIGTAVFDGIVWGVKEGTKALGSVWADAFKNPSVEGFAGAGIATAIAASIASLVLSPLFKGISLIGKGAKGIWGAGKKVKDVFTKGKGPKVPPVATRGSKAPKTPNNPKGSTRSNRSGKPTYTHPWFDKGKGTDLNVPNKKAPKKLKTFSKILDKLPGKGLLKKVPFIGPAISGLTLLTATKQEKPSAIGSIGGGVAGAAIGTAILPGVGTAIGGVLGSVGGQWLGDNWETIKTKASEAASSIGNAFNTAKEGISNTLFNGEWWKEKWEGVKSWTSEKWSNATELWNGVKEGISSTIFSGDWWSEKWNGIKELTTTTIFSAGWWAEQAGKVYGFLEGTIFSGDWWSQKWQAVKELAAGTMFSGDWWKEKWEGVKTWTSEKWDSAVTIWQSVKTKFAETVFNSDWWLGKWESVKGWAQEKWDSAQSVWNSVKTRVSETVFSGDWWLNKWESVKGWTQTKWDSAQATWDSVTSKINETIFSGDWWKGHWDNVTGWAQEKWDGAQGIWDSVKTTLGDTLFDGEWWKGKWDSVRGWAEEKLSGIGSWVSGLVEDVKVRFSGGREEGKEAASKYANGGMITRPHLGIVGEAGPEMIIPLSSNRRDRAMDLYNKTGNMLGVRPYANGGLAGGTVKVPKPKTVQASVNVGSVSVQGMDKEAKLYGEAFTSAVASGINGKVVSINNWKKNNIQNPMQDVVKEAVGFGSSTVNSFSSGQKSTRTNTSAYLNEEVKRPFKVIEGGASKWGTGTVNGFRSGQDSSVTGTRPYLVSNVHQPFESTKAKGSGWGSGTISEFVSGMRSQGEQVEEASKYLADQVEKTFKEELGIHSPSRVMAILGRFASLGIVKGLGSIDIKKFAEGQAGSLAAAFSGLGAVGGNVQSWLQSAMMITGVPSSWLDPLGIIAQKESGGNPLAQNNWDINAKNGIPSKGLMQTIGPTFDAYKEKGMNDIFNPIHNAAASINYILSRYGNIWNVPGIKSMLQGGQYKGYYKGTNGPLNKTETAWVGERGPELVRLPRGSEVYSNEESMDMVSGNPTRIPEEQLSSVVRQGSDQKRSMGKKLRDVVVQISGDNHFYNETNVEEFAQKVVSVIEKELENEYREGGEMVVYD